MEQKIIIPENITLEEIKTQVDKGALFITYQYCISVFFAVTLIRLSPAFFILPNENLSKYKGKYDLYTKLFGWWGIPWGPINSMKSLKCNRLGGIDITKDIMLNLNEDSLENQIVKIVELHTLFGKPPKSDLKELVKCVNSIHPKENLNSIVVGLFLNTEDNIEPYFVIGIGGGSDFDQNITIVENALYKRYRKHVPFEFIDLNLKDDELSLKLIEQGERLV